MTMVKRGYGNSKKGKYRQGHFVPRNPEKYRGTVPIVFRSSWERKYMNWCDLSESVLEWGSESVVVQYFDPVKRKTRRYFTDFYIKYKKDGKIVTRIVEIKPYRQTRPPQPKKGKRKMTLLYEQKTYATNQAKWDATRALCRKKGWEFVIVTEKDL